MVNVGKACTLIRDYKSIILDRDRELRWFLCKNGVLRDFWEVREKVQPLILSLCYGVLCENRVLRFLIEIF